MIVERMEKYEGVSQVDPLIMLKYVGKVIQIKTVYGQCIKGTVVTIDPISESFVLTNVDNDIMNLKVVLGRCIKSFEFLDEIAVPFNFKCSNRSKLTANVKDEESMTKLMNKLVDWFVKNFIPVEQDGNILKIGDAVTIHPPYGVENVFCTNEMVLQKMINIIEKMPSD